MITYGSTTLTSYNTITKIEVYYYKSTSATSLSGGSWSTTKPTWENDKYIWQKTRTTYEGELENGQYYSESDPVNITGQQGQTGTAAYSYKLNTSDTSITVSKDGTYSKTKVTFSATYKQGTGAVTAYAGRFKIETTANGTTWTTQYTSSANESSKEYTIPTGILNIRCSLYQAGGTSVLLDIVSVAIVTDGIDGTSQNLLLDVYASSLTKVKASWDRYLSDASNTTITGEFIAESNLPDPNATHFYRITDSSASTKGRGLCFYSNGTPPFINGHTYRIGCWVRNHAGQPKLFIYVSGLGTWSSYKLITSSEWQWVECVHTFGDLDPTINSLSSTYKRLYFYFYNNNVEGSSLDMCGFKVEEVQTDISTARNILLKTEKLEDWGIQNGATISDGTATFPEVTENTTRRIYSPNFKYELIRNQNVIFSVRVKADAGKICACNIYISLKSIESAISSLKWCNNYVYFTGTGEWKTICIAAPITDEWFYSGTGSPDYDNCWAGVGIEAPSSYHNSFQVKEPQLSLGTTATAWSAAPEDVEANIQQVQTNLDNLEIGGRNLLLNTNKFDSHKFNNSSGGGTWTFNGDEATYTATAKSWARLDLSYNPDMPSADTSSQPNMDLLGDTTITLSIEAKCEGECNGSLYLQQIIYGNNNNRKYYPLTNPTADCRNTFVLTENWQRYSVTLPADYTNTTYWTSDSTQLSYPNTGFGALVYWNSTGTVHVRKPKLERGQKATDWTPAPEDVEEEISNLRTDLQSQIDEKIQTYYQSTNPASSWTTTELRTPHDGDLWYYTGTTTSTYTKDNVYRYNASNNTWVVYSASGELFDKVDGKSTIYYGTTSGTYTGVETGDYLVDSTDGSSYRWDGSKWVKVTDYKTAIDDIEIGGRNLIRNTTDWKNCPYAGDTASINGEEFIAPTTTGTIWRRINGWFTKTKEDIYSSPIVISFDVKKSDETPLSELVFQLFTTSKAYKEQTSGNLPEGTRYYINLTNSIWKNTENVNKDTWTRVYSIPIIMQECFNTTSYTEYDYLAFYIGVKAATGSASFRHLKIELGNKATDWTPAPEDVEDSIKAYAQSIQSQVDGMAEIHYGTVAPTLSNAPYTSWSDTETKDMHLDDLYYNTSTGYCYRFTKSGSTYSWTRIKDSDITAAATAASNANTAAGNAQTTANNANTLAGQKRRIFVATPTTPYEVGDLWVEGSSGDIKKCKTARATGSYTASDWELASKYTDDTKANTANTKVDNLKKVRLGWKVNYSAFATTENGECYFHGYDSNNAPADVDGKVEWNGTDLTITKGLWINPNTIAPYGKTILHIYRTGTSPYHADVWWDDTLKKWRGYMYKADQTPNTVVDWEWNETTDCILATYVSPSSEGAIQSAQLFNPPKKFSEIPNAHEIIKNLEIGGRNLLRGTRTQDVSYGNYQNSVTVTNDTFLGCAVFKSSAAWADIGFNLRTQIINKNLVKTGDILTYSVWAKTDDTENRDMWGIWVGSYVGGTKIGKITSEWQQYYKTFEITQAMIDGTDTIPTRLECNTTCTSGKYIYWAAPKLERGSKATDWTLAPEDVDANMQDMVDNIEIGGRNLAVGSPGEDWYTVNIVDGTNKPISLVSTAISSHSTLLNIPQIPDIKVGDIIQISFDIKFGSNWTATGTGTKGSIIQGNYNNGGGSWQNLSLDGGNQKEKLEEIMASSSKEGHVNTWFKVTSNHLNGTYTGLTLINIRFDYYSGEVSVKHVMVEKGNKATNWTPSPEDVKYNIQQVQDNLDNLEIGGRNLFRNSKALTTSWTLQQATVADGVVTITPTTNADRRMYQMPTNGYWAWTLGQEYTVSVAARSDNGASFVFQANGAAKYSDSISVTSDWRRYSFTFVAATAGVSSMSFTIVETSEKTIQFKEPKLEHGGKATSWTPAPEDTQADIDTAIAQSVEYIIGTQTAATGNWTGVSSSLTELKDGTQIRYWLPYAGSGNATLNLTLKDGTSTGAIPIYRQGGSYNTTSQVVVANRVTTHFPAGTSISMVYGVNRIVSAVSSSVTYTGTFTGWFADGAYDSGNTYNRTRMQNAITAATAITAGRIICGTSSGYKNIGANVAFDLSYPLLYASSAISASATGDNNYLQINGVGASNNGTITSGAAKKELYLKGTVSGNTFTISASPFMTTVVPTSADGFYYIPLGMMYSATAIYFISSNRLYAYIDGAFQPVDTAAVLRAQDAKNLATAVYGTCSTTAETAAKIVACDNFILFNGARIQITFTYANTANVPTLNVNNTGAKSIYINKSVVSASNQLLWGAGSKMEFVYDGTGWILQNAPFSLYGTCNAASATVNKEVTCNEAVICKASIIYIKMTYSNTAASAKLNVASTGVKNIKANGADLTANSRFNWNAGATIAFTFDGQYWTMSDDTITAYVTDTSDDGIMVHPVNDQNTGWSIGNSIQLLKNSISYIKLWLENSIAKIRIGEEDKGHIIIDNDSVDVMNNTTCLASFGSTSTIGRSDGAHIEQSSGGLKVVDADGSNQVTFGAQSATVTWESATTIVPASTSDSNMVQIDLPTELASDQDMTLTIGTATYTIPTKQTYSYTHADYTISYDGAYLVQVTNLSTSDLNIALDYPITQPTNYGITATTPNNTRIKARVYANNQVVAEGGIYANDAGNFGLFDTKRAKWMIVSTSDGTVKIPSLIPKLLYAKKVYANTTQFQWNYMDIQLKQWAVIAIRANVNNVSQYLLFFSPASGSSQHLSDRPGQTVYVRGGFKVDWAQNKIYVRWTEGGSSYAQYVFFDQVIGLIRK